MRGPGWHRARPGSIRPLVVILLYVSATTASSSFGVTQSVSPGTETFSQAASRALAHGRIDDAERLARSRSTDDPEAAAVLARIALRRGEHDAALRLLEPASAIDPAGNAALEHGLLLQRVGRSEEASALLTRVFRQASSGSGREVLLRAGRAAQALGLAQEANALYRSASSRGADPAVDTAWGVLFLEKYDGAEALRSFKQAIDADAQWAPAHVGLARTLADEDPPAAAAAAERALEIDPDLADAHLTLADLDLDNTRYEEARARIDRVLSANPSHFEARALLGAIAYVKDDRAGFEAEVRQVLAINPAYGEIYRVAADLAARHYRFDEAVALARQAITLDPTNTRAFADVGMHLMRTGDEAGARQALERSFKDDPFDRVTFNLLALLDTLEKFEVVEEDGLIVKLHPDEVSVMREYVLPLTQEALSTLSAKYQFTPEGPILIEVFPEHDDFAVRNLGLPGLIGALGACFGRVVTLDSPRARPPGSFSWQATLWHELAHVITLQMSKQRVPRWLTEGVSVYEEGRARPEWGRDMEVPFALAIERGQVLKVRDLNSGFTKPETIALAYYQASLLVEHIVDEHGEDRLRTLLRSYGTGLEGEAAITEALGVSFDQLQASFDRMLDTRFAALRAALRDGAKAAPADTRDVATLREAAAARPGSYHAQLALGTALAAQRDPAAFEALQRAVELVPLATGENSPYAVMGRLAEELGDTARAIAAYEALLSRDHAALEPARRLADLAAKAGNERARFVAYQRVVEIDPFDAAAHTGLGRLALERGDARTAAREFRVALAIGPADRAAAHCDLGESYLLTGRTEDAKREALAALEIAPSFERAQDLLLKVVEGKDAPGGGRW